MRRAMLGTVGAWLLLTATPGARPSQSAAERADAILEDYEARDFDAAVALIRGEKSAAKLVRAFEARAGAWVDEAPPAQAAFRRRIAASVALEIVAERMDPDWDDVRDLVEWGCRVLRRGTEPAEWERAWLLGSIALGERAHDYALLLGDPSAAAASLPLGDPASLPVLQRLGVADEADQSAGYLHLAHAIARFPDEPRFELAHIVMSDPAWVDLPAAAAWPDEDALKRAAPQPGLDAVHTEIARRYWLRTVAASYVALADKAPALAVECHARAGVAYWRLHQFAAASDQFRRAASADPMWRSLTAFFRGDLAERAADRPAAMALYREALDADAGARAAAARLGSLLFLSGEREEAEDVMTKSLRAPAHDPWRDVAYGDYRQWPEYRRELRAETPR